MVQGKLENKSPFTMWSLGFRKSRNRRETESSAEVGNMRGLL